MYGFKTASAAVATAGAGCILAGSAPEVRDACTAYARALGIAFQITDDIQSFLQNPGTGSIQGDDLAAGKLTYVIARALELLDSPDRSRLRHVLCSENLRQDRGSWRRELPGSGSPDPLQNARQKHSQWRIWHGRSSPGKSLLPGRR
jgi:geranylgeranyl pyrophosphate synthase